MSRDLQLDVTARGDANGLLQVAEQAKALARELRNLDGRRAKAHIELAGAELAQAQARAIRTDVDGLDGRTARVRVSLDAASSAPVQALTRQVEGLDGKTARAKVDVAGAEGAAAKTAALDAELRGLPRSVTTTVNVDLDRGVGARLSAARSGISGLVSAASSAPPALRAFRAATRALVDPGSLPVVERVSSAIAGRFHAAVDKARVVVGKLATANKVLGGSLVALGAVGNTVQVIGGVTAAVTQLSGAAVLLPGVLLGAEAAVSTLKVGFAGFGDAVKAADPKKFAEATKDMTGRAKAAAVAVREMTTALSSSGAIGKPVQTALFRGIAEQIQGLNRTYIPVLRSGMTGIATGFNAMGREALSAVGKASSVSQVATIFANTSTAVGRMKMSVANAATGFLALGAAGSTYLPRLGSAIDLAAGKFNTWAQRVTSDGSFDRWAAGGIVAVKQLGTIAGNVGSILGSVFSALSASGGGALASFAQLTGTLKDFLHTAQGSTALSSFAGVVTAAGNALSQVLGVALRAVAPLITALGPALSQLAVSIGAHLTAAIGAATPLLTRFADLLSQNPQVLVHIAKAVGVAAVAFGPFVAVLGIAGTLLKAMLLGRLAAAAIGALGIEGTIAARVMTLLATPLAGLRAELPLLANGLGSLVARLVLFAGPVGALIVGFAALYASSSQFRAGINDIAGTIGRLFTKALQDAGSIINSTVALIRDIGSAIDSATRGIQSFGSSVLSVFGPLGRAISGALSGLFDVLGKLPGAALAAYAAFRVFGLIAPLFTTASAAVAGFSARMIAFQGASGVATVAATGVGVAAGKVSTALSKVGAALPLIGVALIAVGFAYDAVRSKATEAADAVINGSQSMTAAVKMESEQLSNQSRLLPALFDAKGNFIGLTAQSADASKFEAEALGNVKAAIESQIQAMGPLEGAQARVRISSQNLRDLQLSGSATSQQLADATAVLARDKANLAGMEKTLADATRGSTEALKAQADQMATQIDTALAYAQAVQRTAQAQRDSATALKDHGAKSDEYKSSVLDLAQAMSSQADAARRQAEALGGAGAGISAYNTELLRTANLSTKSGRDAFAQLAAGMDSTGLAALSAAAKASGLRTEIMKLPDGRTVTVIAAVDQGKLPEVKKTVEDLAAKPYVGTITLLSNTDLAHGAILETLRLADGSTGTLKISADGRPALLTVGQTKYTVDSTTGMIKVLGDVAPGEASLAGFKLHVDTTTGAMTLEANTAPALQKFASAKGVADTSIGTMTLDGNPALVNGKTTAAVTLANGSRGVLTLDGNPDPATGKISATVAYGNGQVSRIQVTALDNATGSINWIARPRYTTVTVATAYTSQGAVGGPALTRAAHGGDQGAIVSAYAEGGIRRLTPMRGDVAQRVPANSWRVIGDRMRGDEFFLPDDAAPRTMTIGAEWARRRGLSLVATRSTETGATGQVTRPLGTTRPVAAAFAAGRGIESGAVVAALGRVEALLRHSYSGPGEVANPIVAALRRLEGLLTAAAPDSATVADARRVGAELARIR